MSARVKMASLIIIGVLFAVSSVGWVAPAEQGASISPATWWGLGLLVVLIMIGLALGRVKAKQNKEEIRHLMEEIKKS